MHTDIVSFRVQPGRVAGAKICRRMGQKEARRSGPRSAGDTDYLVAAASSAIGGRRLLRSREPEPVRTALESSAGLGVSAGLSSVKRVRCGKTGVTSSGIFSRAVSSCTGLLLLISMRLFQGSTLMRPPRGSAATWVTFLGSSLGAVLVSSVRRRSPPEPVISELPMSERIRWGRAPRRASTWRRKRPTDSSLSV